MIYQELSISFSSHHHFKRTLNVSIGHGSTIFLMYTMLTGFKYDAWLQSMKNDRKVGDNRDIKVQGVR